MQEAAMQICRLLPKVHSSSSCWHVMHAVSTAFVCMPGHSEQCSQARMHLRHVFDKRHLHSTSQNQQWHFCRWCAHCGSLLAAEWKTPAVSAHSPPSLCNLRNTESLYKGTVVGQKSQVHLHMQAAGLRPAPDQWKESVLPALAQAQL